MHCVVCGFIKLYKHDFEAMKYVMPTCVKSDYMAISIIMVLNNDLSTKVEQSSVKVEKQELITNTN